MKTSGVISIFLLTQISWLTIAWETVFPNVFHPMVPLSICTVFFLMAIYLFFPRTYTTEDGVECKRDVYYYFFCYFAFNAVVSFRLFLQAFGLIDDTFSRGYLTNNEQYLEDSHGMAFTLWDSTVFYPIYFIMIYKQDNKIDYTCYGLYWSGALCYSMFILLCTETTIYHIEAFFFNIPYILSSYVYIVTVCLNHKPTTSSRIQSPLNLTDVSLLIGLLYCISFSVIHGLAALDHPFIEPYVETYEPYLKKPFAVSHCLIECFFSVPMFCCMMYGVYHQNIDWLPKLSVFHTGVTTAGTFAHVYGMLSERTPIQYRVEHAWIVVLNVLVPLVVLLTALHSNKMKSNEVKTK